MGGRHCLGKRKERERARAREASTANVIESGIKKKDRERAGDSVRKLFRRANHRLLVFTTL